MEAFNNISLYNNMINYAKSVVYKNKSNICPVDLVHDLILEKQITESNYIQEIKSVFLIERRTKDKHTDIIGLAFEWHGNKSSENVYSTPCKRCQESYPVDFFRKRTLKNVFIQIYYICKKCESKDVTTRLRKIDPITGLTGYQIRHRNKKETDPTYLKKRVIAMQEYRKRKALEKQST
jgi:hypothetical protein